MRTEARATGTIDPARMHAAVGPTPVTVVVSAVNVPVSRFWLFGILTPCLLAWDLGSKWWVFAALGCPGRSLWEWQARPFVQFVLQTTFNEGALWGLGQGYTPVFAALSVIAVVGILYVLFVMKQARSLWLTVALAFVLAGALGNLYDRIGLHGWMRNGSPVYAVRDFLYFRFFETFDWAIFNFADTYLVTGAIMLVIHSFYADANTSREPSALARPAPE